MKEIRLLKLNLRNFKGIKEFNLDLKGSDVSIYGDNATGKTTIMDSFIWLLFDKDSQNSSQFNIKTLDEEGNVIHGLEHEVSAKLEIDNKEIELQKIYKEKWTKKRGQTNSELTGHTTDYFINGVPKKKKEYTEYLSHITDEDTFKILTNPLYFNNNLSWKDRRSIALNICGELEDKEVIKQDSKLKELDNLLEDKSIDDLKAEMSSRRRKLNEELKSIPHRIDELSRNNEEIDVAALKGEKKVLDERLIELKNSKPEDYDFRLRGINGSIKILENELKDSERSITVEIIGEIEQTRKDKFNIEKQHQEYDSKAFKLDKEVIALSQSIQSLDIDTEALREKFRDIKVLEFDDNSTTCPTCNRTLENEKIDKLIKEFEESKAKQLKEINELGKENKAYAEKYKKESGEKQTELDEIKEQLKAITPMLEAKEKLMTELEKELSNIDTTKLPFYKDTKEKIDGLEKERLEIEKLNNNQEDISGKIEALENQISEINKKLSKVDLIESANKRVEELKSRERELSQMVAETEKTEFLCDQYVITKSNLLEEKLNSKFNIVKFKLFDLQVNGGINETFITTVDGIPFEDLNNAMRINAGLDIISTLTDYYNFKAPIFIDNRESINKIIDVESQVINLIVSEDKKLKVEEIICI